MAISSKCDMEIRACTVAEVEASPMLPALLAAYAEESRIAEIGTPEANFASYRAMEAAGSLRIIGAFAPELVGFAVLLVYGLPHYTGRMVGSLESFFVSPLERRHGTGMKLLHAAEDLACDLGAVALMVGAPVGSRLDTVLEHAIGYRPTNRVFTRRLT